MRELITQFKDNVFTPNTPEDLEIAKKEYQQYQLVRIKTFNVGAKKERSLTQLGLLHACFNVTAENTDNPMLNTPAKVKFACKVHIHFVVPDVVYIRKDGTIQFLYRSFCFDELDHMEACNVFEQCFEYMAEILGITKEKLIEEAKSKMQKLM